MKDTGNEQSKTWKIIGTVSIAILAVVSGYLTLKNDFLPNIDKWLSPVSIEKRPIATVEQPKYVAPTPETMLQAVNKIRTDAGVSPLQIDPRLNASAQAKADDMKKRNYFGHQDPDGMHGYQIAAYFAPECVRVGENLQDSGIPVENTVEKDFAAWKKSPSHYEQIIKSEYSYTGFGITSTGVVEHFCEL